ncbi:MAG: phosphate-starvation-inducible PsiE family protein [Haloplanus sp.]
MPADERVTDRGPVDLSKFVAYTEYLIHLVEAVAALVLVVLFAIGVFDLGVQILDVALAGRITDPLVVVGFIDTILLLFIIVEVYQTVVAYTRESHRRRIVRLVLYTGVIAMVRKAIIFRTETYASKTDALLAATAYAVLLLAIGVLLYVERTTAEYDDRPAARKQK